MRAPGSAPHDESSGTDPPEQPADTNPPTGRLLDRAPGDRYRGPGSDSAGPTTSSVAADGPGSAVDPGLAHGSVGLAALVGGGIAAIGALGLVILAGVLAQTTGLLALSAVMGWLVGLSVSRLAGDRLGASGRIGVSIGIVTLGLVVAAAGTWLYARSEGGVLGPLDFLLETYGLIVPAEFAIGAMAAAWSAR